MSQFDLDLGFQYKSLKSRSRSIAAVESQAKSRGAEYSEFGADFFNALFQKNPKLKDNIDYSNKYNQVLRAFSQSEKFQQIRAQTKGNLNWSAIGASMLLDELSKVVDFTDEQPPEAQDKPEPKSEPDDKDQEENEKEENSSDNSEEQTDDESDSEESSEEKSEESGSDDNGDDKSEPENNEGDMGGSEGESGENLDNDEESDIDNEDGDGDLESDGESEDLDNEWNNSEDFSEDSLEQGPEVPVDQAVQDALDKAAEKMAELIGGIKAGSGGSMPGGDAQMVDAYVRLATNQSLVKLMRMVGRLKLNNNFLSALAQANPEENLGVTIGNNIQRTLPRDLVRLAGDDDDFMIFMNKFNNKELLERKYQSTNKPGKGPMIICLDCSSSMSGERMEWAQTIAAAMYTLASKEHRAFALVPFNSNSYLHEAAIKGNGMDVNMLATILGMRASGGTSFEMAWQTSLEFMRKKASASKWKNADIVFVTDGEDGIDKDKWLKDKGVYKARLFTFVIGMDEDEANGVWSDEYIAKTYQLSQQGTMHRYYQHLYGQLAHPTQKDMQEVSDAIVYVKELSVESESQAFQLVKSAQQKRGQMVKK